MQARLSPIVEIKEPRSNPQLANSDWKQDLDKLVVDNLKRKDAQLGFQQAAQLGLSAQVLLEEAVPAQEARGSSKRTADNTVTDVKIWWGEALTPWNASMARDLHAQKQTPDTVAHKRWFGY